MNTTTDEIDQMPFNHNAFRLGFGLALFTLVFFRVVVIFSRKCNDQIEEVYCESIVTEPLPLYERQEMKEAISIPPPAYAV